MSPIRTRAQIRRKSGVSPPPSLPAATGKALQPPGPIAPATHSSIIKKPARPRTSFKIEVLADRTSSVNVAQQKKLRRMTSFHPETVSLIEATPVDELKKVPSVQVNEKRRRRGARTSPRTSLHVHWAENLRRVAPISPSPNTSVVHRDQGQQISGQPRSILRVFRDDEPPRPPPSDIAPAGTLIGNPNVLGTPLYALPEVPRGITVRRRLPESRVSLHPCSSRSPTFSVDDTPSGLSSPVSGESSGAGAEQAPCATLRVPVRSTRAERNGSAPIPPSRPQATRTTGTMTSATQAPRVAADGPPAILGSSAPVRPTRTKARRPTNNPINDRVLAPAPLPTEMPAVRQQGWLKLPENRVDRWIMIFYMVYAPIILPLLLRVLDSSSFAPHSFVPVPIMSDIRPHAPSSEISVFSLFSTLQSPLFIANRLPQRPPGPQQVWMAFFRPGFGRVGVSDYREHQPMLEVGHWGRVHVVLENVYPSLTDNKASCPLLLTASRQYHT